MIALESMALFRNLSPDELQALRSIAQERHFSAAGHIFHESDPGDGVYFIINGILQRSPALAFSVARQAGQVSSVNS
jgi:CRP-like cAMP-binding protein